MNVAVALAAMTVGACNEGGTGHVEVKVGAAFPSSRLTLLLGTARLGPFRSGATAVKQAVGTSRLRVDRGDGRPVSLCEIIVAKNRVTSVTVSIQAGTIRCECGSPPRRNTPKDTCTS